MSILRTNQIQDTGTNVAANISGGVVTFTNTPSTPNGVVSGTRPAFIATMHGADQTNMTGGSTTPTTMIFTNTSAPYGINTGNHYSTTTGKFTAPVAGVYFFCFSVLLNSVSNSDDGIHIAMTYEFASGGSPQMHFFSRTNGEAANSDYGYGGYLPWNGSIIFNMAVNDTVKMGAGSSGTIGVYGDRSQNRFQGFLVG